MLDLIFFILVPLCVLNVLNMLWNDDENTENKNENEDE